MERVYFYEQGLLPHHAEEAFLSQKARIKKLIPNADIQHVGSTAIPNSLTKGDLDIQVRVLPEQFAKAVRALSVLYEENNGSVKTDEFRAFKDDTIAPPLGVQLTVFHSEFDFFWIFRDVLLQNDMYRKEYDQLKKKYEGEDMDAYREAKADFFEKIKATAEYRELKADRNRE